MSLTKSPASNFGSGSNLRTIMTTGAAALIGTVVGGVSVLGVVVAVTPPPNHEIQSDARGGGGIAAPPAPAPVQAATPPPQTGPVAQSQSVPPVEGPRTVWPDALSARANHNAETETPAPQQASPPANDRTALNQNDGAGRDPSVANSSAVTSRDSLPKSNFAECCAGEKTHHRVAAWPIHRTDRRRIAGGQRADGQGAQRDQEFAIAVGAAAAAVAGQRGSAR